MKAIALVDKKSIKVDEIPKPTPKQGEVLVKVAYSVLDTAFKEVQNRSVVAWMFLHNLNAKPLVPGYHFSGTIESVGEEGCLTTTDLKTGDKVFGHLQYSPSTLQGSLSEYITVPELECDKVPEGVGLDVAAIATSEALTAIQALKDEASLSEGNSILIIAAGGAVGSQAIQIAKAMKAGKVHGVCSTKDAAKVKELGADLVIDYTKTNITKNLEAESYDIIFDATDGKYSFFSMKYALKEKGTFVCTIPNATSYPPISLLIPLISGKYSKLVNVRSKQNDLELIGAWLQSGQITVDVDSTYSVKNFEDAIMRQEHPERLKSSRVVIKVDDGW